MAVDDFNFEKEYEKAKQNIGKPNILICGATGVGKSSIINYLFGEKVAKVGSGAPVTRGYKEYKSDSLGLVLYDSEGYEIGHEKLSDFKKNTIDLIDEREKEKLEKQIHIVWYCISAGNKRITNLDLEVIKQLKSRNVNIAILFTQIDSVDSEELNQLINVVKKELSDIPYFRVSTEQNVPEEYLDWSTMIDWSIDNLDKTLKSAFIKALQTSLEEKKRLVDQKIVPIYMWSAGAVGASPMPFSDAALLMPIQVTMSTHILMAYDIDGIKNSIKSIVGSTVTSQAGKMIAKTLGANAIKLIPGLGSVVGAAINGSVAVAFTGGMGYAISELTYRYASAMYRGEDVKIADIFKSESINELFKEFYNEVFKNRKGDQK